MKFETPSLKASAPFLIRANSVEHRIPSRDENAVPMAHSPHLGIRGYYSTTLDLHPSLVIKNRVFHAYNRVHRIKSLVGCGWGDTPSESRAE